jgi:very-short-patch-repair endonuclease
MVPDAMTDDYVQHLRANATRAETLLWHQLRRKRVAELRFRRQFRLGRYIVDFVCLPARLVIEVDGASHDLTCSATWKAWCRRSTWCCARE